MKTHEIKILDTYFDAVYSGAKPFEIRFNDRGYEVGDLLMLKEIRGSVKSQALTAYTGRELARFVTYVTDYEQKDGFVVMGLAPTYSKF